MLFILLFISSLTLSLSLNCPSIDLTWPCKCSKIGDETTIKCGGSNRITSQDIREAFVKISNDTAYRNRTFTSLEISNKKIETLEADITDNVKFEEIHLCSAVSLKKIISNAFRKIASSVKFFSVADDLYNLTTSNNSYNLFDLINKFVNVETIHFHLPQVTRIPKHAFRLPKLKALRLGNWVPVNQSMKIEDSAFKYLDQLTVLDLSGNRIKEVSSGALRFRNDSSKVMHLHLSTNSLTGNSFANDSLSELRRPTMLSLFNNRIAYFLDVDHRNTISSLLNNTINCSDCRNFWLAQEAFRYEARVKYANCGGNVLRPFFRHDWSKIGCGNETVE